MDLLQLIYLLSFLSFGSFVLLFSFAFGAIPGNWYKWKLPQLQFIFATISFLSGVLNCIIAIINDEYLNEINTLYTTSFLKPLTALYAIFFFASIYKFVIYGKKSAAAQNEYIFLHNTEYQISNKFELTLGDLIYTPNVESYAITKDYIIIFSGARPEKEIDAGFICKKIGDKTYDCLAYINLDKRFRLKRIFNQVVNLFVVIGFLSMPFLNHYLDSLFMATGSVSEFQDLYGYITVFLLCTLFCKLFKNVEGFFGRIIYFLCLFSVICSVIAFIDFLI